MDLIGVLLFIVALIASIVLHEAGHMVCARLAGGKVTDFFVGFGAKLWSFKRGETEYGVRAIPAGGFVKIVGMTDLDEVEPGDEGRALRDKPARWRLLTMAAGSLTHFLIALVVFFIVPMAFGVEVSPTTTEIQAVAACMTSDGSTTTCNGKTQPAPAAQAGLKQGDSITTVNGVAVKTYDQMVTALHDLPEGRVATITYTDPAGAQHTTTLTPVHALNVQNANGTVGPASLIGISGVYSVKHDNPLAAASFSGSSFWQALGESFQGLGAIPAAIPKLFSSTIHHTQRSVDSPVSVVGLAQAGGSVFQIAGFDGLFMLLAGVNVVIGVLNLLPLLPLDGGHIAILLFEQVRKRLYKLVRKPDPGRVDLNKLMPVAYAFILVLVCVSLLVIAADVTNPIKLPS